MYLLLCLAVFGLAYALNVFTITIGYHRSLAHTAVKLHPRLRRLLIVGGNWITGLDPKAWSVMHRMHHAYSDTPEDPHSPVNVGITGILLEQLRSYKRTIVGLVREEPRFMEHTDGLDFELSWLNRSKLWWLPYALHGLVAGLIALSGAWLLGAAYFLGMMSHPTQGGMVNAFGHAVGGRNFDLDDDSRNNTIVAWLVAGEGLQNNHHAYPDSPKFSYLRSEVDLGYGACRLGQALGLLTIQTEGMIPSPPARASEATQSLG